MAHIEYLGVGGGFNISMKGLLGLLLRTVKSSCYSKKTLFSTTDPYHGTLIQVLEQQPSYLTW